MNDTQQQSTIVGVFDDYSTAQTAARELMDLGIPREDVNVQSNLATGAAGHGGATYDETTHEHEGGVKGFFHRLFGGDDEEERHHDVYSEAVRRGSSVVVVRTRPEVVDQAVEILNRRGAVDIDQRAESYREGGWREYDHNAKPYTSEQARTERERFRGTEETRTIPVVEEQLTIGKRVIRRGGVRVYTEVVEEPVSENVNLHDERVRVERRPVDREARPGETGDFRDQSIEMTETVEEPVVSKRARVVEEVVVGKDVTNRTEKVTDTVRKTKVNVENLEEGAKPRRRDRE